MTYRRKLIEVALPLDAINRSAAKRENLCRVEGIQRRYTSGGSRKPLAVCRGSTMFASLVDDPSSRPEEFPTKARSTT